MIRRLPLLVVAALFVLGACSGAQDAESSSPDGSAPSPSSEGDVPVPDEPTPSGCDPARPAPAGQTSESLTVDGVERHYLLDVPAGYDGTEAVPLILDLHGYSSSAAQQVAYSGLPEAAAEVGAVVASLDGTGTPRGFALNPSAPDVTVVERLLDELEGRLCIDADRLGSTGISNGSAASAILACALDGRLASIGMVAATVGPFACDDATRVSVIAFHGTADRTVPYDGGEVSSASGGAANGLGVPPAEEAIAAWAAQDGCSPGPDVGEPAPDVRLWEYVGCDEGTAVHFYRIEGIGHVWPGSPVPFELLEARLGPNSDSVDAAELIVDFIATHPRPV